MSQTWSSPKGISMNFCEHCEGQRFDRARILRKLRVTRQNLRKRDKQKDSDEALGVAIRAIRALDIPHLEPMEELEEQVVH